MKCVDFAFSSPSSSICCFLIKNNLGPAEIGHVVLSTCRGQDGPVQPGAAYFAPALGFAWGGLTHASQV